MQVRSNRPRVSLRTRLGIVAIVFLVLVLVAVGISALMVRSWNSNIARTAEAAAVAERVDELRLSYTDQEAAVVGYRIFHDADAVAEYRDGRAIAQQVLGQLEARELDDPVIREQLAGVRAAADAWDAAVVGPILADDPTAPGDATARAVFDELRAELDLLSETATSDLADLDRRTDRVRQITLAVLFLSALGAIAGTAMVTVLFRRWITEPLARLHAAVLRLGDDDTGELPDTTVPELHEITSAIRELQGSLVQARDRAVTAYEGLSQSALLALQVRAELADEIGRMPDGWAAASRLIPAEGIVAGDCFDVGLLDADHLYVVMIDVAGHGAEVALDALMAKGQLRAALRMRRQPGEALDWLAREQGDFGNQLTAIVATIELPTGRIKYANAGHPPMLMTDGERFVALERTGPLLGAFPASWRTATTVLDQGWSLVVHTDGVTDVVNGDRDRFGDERMRACFANPDPRTAIRALHASVEKFRSDVRADDLTILVLRRLAGGDEVKSDRAAVALGSLIE